MWIGKVVHINHLNVSSNLFQNMLSDLVDNTANNQKWGCCIEPKGNLGGHVPGSTFSSNLSSLNPIFLSPVGFCFRLGQKHTKCPSQIPVDYGNT
jgi:hypothetical protein